MANASQFWFPVCLRLALSLWFLCKDRFDLSRCDPLNSLFIPEWRGERQTSPSARCLIKLIKCELGRGCRPPPLFLSAYLCRCKKQLRKTCKNDFPLLWECADGLPVFGPSWEQHNILQMTLARARSWQRDQTHCKQLKRHFM